MTYQSHYTLPPELLEQIAAQGLEALPELIRIVINTAMQTERQHYLQVEPYERSTERQGHANGSKPKTVTTRVGGITFNVPHVREGGFYPQALEKGLRSERALLVTLAEMYVQGVSTRKGAAITEQLCGCAISSTQVSRATAQLDAVFAQWRQRPLGRCPSLFLDARYEKVRDAGQIRDVAVLLALGVTDTGKRELLGVSVSLSEQEVHWRTFLRSLVERGLGGVQLIISDAHTGLQAARQAVFGSVPWPRCQFHLQQHAQSYVPRLDLKATVAADIRAIFNAPNWTEAEVRLGKLVQTYTTTAPRLATWAETNLPDGFTVFGFPASHQRRLRTTNGLERLNREVLRRTKVIGIFPNEAACLRLVSAIAMETSDEWAIGKAYLTFPTE